MFCAASRMTISSTSRNKVDPIADADVVETELMLARTSKASKSAFRQCREARHCRGQGSQDHGKRPRPGSRTSCAMGKPARLTEPNDEEEARVLRAGTAAHRQACPLCLQRVAEEDAAKGNDLLRIWFSRKPKAEGAQAVVVSAAIESELVEMEAEDRAEYLAELGLEESGLSRVIRAGYTLLGLQTFFHRRPAGIACMDLPDRGQGSAGRR